MSGWPGKGPGLRVNWCGGRPHRPGHPLGLGRLVAAPRMISDIERADVDSPTGEVGTKFVEVLVQMLASTPVIGGQVQLQAIAQIDGFDLDVAEAGRRDADVEPTTACGDPLQFGTSEQIVGVCGGRCMASSCVRPMIGRGGRREWR